MISATISGAALAELRAVVGAAHVAVDDTTRIAAGSDVFFEHAPPLAVVSPATADEVRRVVMVAAKHGLTLAPRGGGLSYSAAYLTDRADTLCIDTRRMNRIVEINAEDMVVHVEAGVTWAALDAALAKHNLRTPFWGTGSGLHATVGATLSNNAANYGTGQYGMAADSALGLRVVLADGSTLATGSWAAADNPSPFVRHYGPDLTGLFIGDCGAFGIKTDIALQLIPRPAATAHGAFEFAEVENFLVAMSAVGRAGIHAECFGFDPAYMSFRNTHAAVGEDLQRLAGVAKSQGSVIKGITEAIKVAAAGRRYLADAGYTLHMTVDGRDETNAQHGMAELIRMCLAAGGKEIPASIPKIMRGSPFPPPTLMLGPRGERWIPVHGIVPHSRARAALDGVTTAMNARAADIERHNISWCWVSLPVGRSAILIEPTLYWHDRRSPMQDATLPPEFARKNDAFAPNPEARAVVHALRQDVADVFRRLGAVHFQAGRSYPFLASRATTTRDMLQSLKRLLDPSHRMNPGSLGL
ncbi:MAG: FAD-binding oxidoreductase [Rhodospirillaceae bacterium]|nr:FAD-binding oxidoreductase [Rhodospirillaceae bacterium]